MDIKAFDNLDDMFAYLDKQRKIVQEWADKNRPEEIINKFDYFLMDYEGFIVVGKKESGMLPREEYEDEEEYQYELEATEGALKNGYVFGKWYSALCPEGELGSNHLSQLIPITKEIFDVELKRIQTFVE